MHNLPRASDSPSSVIFVENFRIYIEIFVENFRIYGTNGMISDPWEEKIEVKIYC
jgi:hypothetical protein